MRASIDFFVSANSTQEAEKKVLAEWRRLTDNLEADLPSSTEVRMQQATEGDLTYMVYVTIKTKIGN